MGFTRGGAENVSRGYSGERRSARRGARGVRLATKRENEQAERGVRLVRKRGNAQTARGVRLVEKRLVLTHSGHKKTARRGLRKAVYVRKVASRTRRSACRFSVYL